MESLEKAVRMSRKSRALEMMRDALDIPLRARERGGDRRTMHGDGFVAHLKRCEPDDVCYR